MIVKLPRMKKSEIQELMEDQMLCRIAFKGDTHPHMAPFQYILMNGSLYFHFTDYGRKMELLERDNRVCVEIERYDPDLSQYCFVVLKGSLDVVTDEEERAQVIRSMSEEGEGKLSTNFLAAHGFEPQEGWSCLSPENSITIIKLMNVVETMGLKSP